MEHFFPRIQVKTKKKGLHQKWSNFLSTDLRSDAHQSQIIGGDADEDHTQIVGGYTVKLLGGYIPPSPSGFGTTVQANVFFSRCKNKNYECAFEAQLRQIIKINELGAITLGLDTFLKAIMSSQCRTILR